MAHHLKVVPVPITEDGRTVTYHQAICSCRWAGPCQLYAAEAFADAKVHAATRDAPRPRMAGL